MTPYANRSGDSGIREYESGPDYIKVRFRHGPAYVYTYARPGRTHVENMKRLAAAGQGLATYISQQIKANYAHKE